MDGATGGGSAMRAELRGRAGAPGTGVGTDGGGEVIVHATAVRWQGRGILLRGPSGAGKSDLALRLIERGADLRALLAAEVMHASPKLVRDDALAVDAAAVMEQHRVTSVLVVDAAGLLVGALNSNDLMRAKVI